MAYKMKGSPARLGTIQGTAGHTSALKMMKEKAPLKLRGAFVDGERATYDCPQHNW